MRSYRDALRVAFAATVAAGLGGATASADNLDLNEMAAALAFPIITGGQAGNPIKSTAGDVIIANDQATTLITVTNGKSDPIRLEIELISGDPLDFDQWQSTSFHCDLTGRETTVFVITYLAATGTDSVLFAECSDLPQDKTDGINQIVLSNVQNGIMFVAVKDPTSGETLSEDVIFGDAIVVDKQLGQAYSFGPIPFQAGKGTNNGDKVYKFDDLEYVQWPSVLATNFLTPTVVGATTPVEAELILFTLDGTTGLVPVPRVKLGGLAYDDDEIPIDFQYEFDCFDIVSLRDLDPNIVFFPGFPAAGLGTMVGHLELTPQPIGSAGFDAHDATYGSVPNDNVRRRPAHGWIVQATSNGFVSANQPIAGTPAQTIPTGDDAAWGRELGQSRTPLVPFNGDQNPTLDAD